MIKNIFEEKVVLEVIERINTLSPETKQLWGKMTVDQMLAHLNVTYEMLFEPSKFKKPNTFKKFILKALVKNIVVGEKAYKKSSPTAPDFIITNPKNFEFEKERLIGFLKEVQLLSPTHFEGLESMSFGPLTTKEWNNLFYKHLDHHLNQFGA